MLPLEFEYVLGDDLASYRTLLSGLPQGDSTLKRGEVVPTHTKETAQSFRIQNVIPNTAYVVDVVGEYETAPVPRLYFSPKDTVEIITLQLPYGPSTVTVQSAYHKRSFFVSVTHYGTIFRSFAREINEYTRQPLSLLDASITEDFAYRLALPLLADMSRLIPSDLEFLGVLSHKLLVKNFLHRPGTNGAVREVLAAFCASNPVLHKMHNVSRLDAPLYRSEETFSGYEAHVWLPNREVERWRAFTLLLANLPQFYSLVSLTEGQVQFEQGGVLRQHQFDFESPFANSIFESTGAFECFVNLFKLAATVESDHFLNFCQASYPLDNKISLPGLSSPDVDPLAITNWTGYSLTGRFEQQYDESDKVHGWVYESPLAGEVNGRNRFYRLRGVPRSSRSLKVWVDGILQYLNIDFRISLGSGNRSGAVNFKAGSAGIEAFKPEGDAGAMTLMSASSDVPTETTPQYLLIETGEPRDFIGPAFTSLEVKGSADLQFLLTVGQQTLTNIGVVLAEPPYGSNEGSEDILQEIAVNYVAPALPAEAYAGVNQYGTVNLPLGISQYHLEFARPATTANYQLLVQLAVDPLPEVGGVSAAYQMSAIVRAHTVEGAIVEFSDEVSQENTKLYWWVIESDEIALERGTVELAEGTNFYRLNFSNGPYTDKVALLYQLWHTSLDVPVSSFFVSHRKINPGGTYIQFSNALPDGSYRLDWCLFGAEAGSFLEFTEAPPTGALLEVQYDEVWPYWGQGPLSPPPDGVRTEFALPFPVEKEESVYLAINGLLATQGNDRQYTIAKERGIARFSLPPTPDQKLWAVYPLKNPITQELPSAWTQGFAFSKADQRGAYATATIKKASARLPVGTYLNVAGREFLGVEPAVGQIIVTGRIPAESRLQFNELNVTLEATSNPVDSFIFDASVVSPLTNSITIPDHGLEDGRAVFLDLGAGLSDLPLGFNAGVQYYVVQATSNTLKLSPILDGPPVDILTSGIGSFQLTSPNENFFKANVGIVKDGEALAACINAHSILSRFYRAEHTGEGRIVVRAKTLGGAAKTTVRQAVVSSSVLPVQHTLGFPDEGAFVLQGDTYRYQGRTEQSLLGVSPRISSLEGEAIVIASGNQTLTFTGSGIIKENISGDTSPSSQSSVTASSAVTVLTVNPDLVDGNAIVFAGKDPGLYNSLPVRVRASRSGPLPTGLSAEKTYYIGSITSDAETGGKRFSLYDEPSGGSSVSLGTITDYFNLSINEVDERTSTIYSLAHSFYEKERVRVLADNGTLPDGLAVAKVYFIKQSASDSFQLSESPEGPAVSFLLNGAVSLSVYSVNTFPTDVAADLDFQQLGKVVLEEKSLRASYFVNVYEESLTISAKEVGPSYNASVTASTALSVQDLSGGLDPIRDQTFAVDDLMYTDQGTVVTLDGLSTRLYTPYGGNEFKFDYRPTQRQEPYYYGEAFPIDYHPFDSMVANEPCNYPKGVFVQGLFSQLTEGSLLHDYNEADRYFKLLITTSTLPFQEEPEGTVDGINRDFYLSLAAIAGQNSIMLFIDGIFQPSTTYQYKVTSGGGGVLTLNTAPASPQKLWVWYIPIDTLRFAVENVDTGLSTINLNDHALYSGQVVSLWASSGRLPGGLEEKRAYYVINPTITSFQLSETEGGDPVVFTDTGLGVFRLNPSDSLLYEKTEELVGDVDGINQAFTIPQGPVDDRSSFILFLEGIFQLQGQDYLVDVGNSSVSYLGDLAPAFGQSVWAHYNKRALDRWRQADLGTTDGGRDTFTISTLLLSDLPTSEHSVLLFLNGLCQRQGVDFDVLKDELGYPTGQLRFLGGAPEANRKVHVAYIKRGG